MTGQEGERFSDRELLALAKDVVEIKVKVTAMDKNLDLHIAEAKADHELLLQHNITIHGVQSDSKSDGGLVGRLNALDFGIRKVAAVAWSAVTAGVGALFLLGMKYLSKHLGLGNE